MNFSLTKEQRMIKSIIAEFAKNEVEPIAAEIDELEKFPMEVVKKMGKMGLLGLIVPREYGGAGVDNQTYVMIIEELCKVCASTGGILAAVNSLYNYPVLTYATHEQKKKFLEPVARGEKLGAFALTEPEAGSDAINQQTTAIEDGDHYIINGNKIFISGGDVADNIIFFAKICKKGRKRGRITAFIVERGTPGFYTGTKEKKLGIRASGTAELVFEDCRIPAANLIGQIGKGFQIAMDTLDGGRISIGSQAVGIAQGALDASLKYSKERKQFGQTISHFQAIQWMIADMATEISASRLLVQKAAYEKDNGLPFGTTSAMAKLYSSETAMRATTKAIQIHGGYGYIKDYPIERYFRDAKITEIYEGTSEVQRMVIAANLLKKIQ